MVQNKPGGAQCEWGRGGWPKHPFTPPPQNSIGRFKAQPLFVGVWKGGGGGVQTWAPPPHFVCVRDGGGTQCKVWLGGGDLGGSTLPQLHHKCLHDLLLHLLQLPPHLLQQLLFESLQVGLLSTTGGGLSMGG